MLIRHLLLREVVIVGEFVVSELALHEIFPLPEVALRQRARLAERLDRRVLDRESD